MKDKKEDSLKREPIEEVVKKLSKYDVISFDIFDTLILRPFLKPTDLFRLLSVNYNIVNFANIRIKAEAEARKECFRIYGHKEIKIKDIYEQINMQTGLDVEKGIKNEFKLEKEFCYANPYMKSVFDKLKELGKEIIIVSDMYLPKEMIEEILSKNGYVGYEKLYVSCEYGVTKRNTKLYEIVLRELGEKTIIHVGDNEVSDIESANEIGIPTYYYKRNNTIENEIKALNMSYTIGNLYKGIVLNSINNGIESERFKSKYYYYGYVYSGLFILGYVNYIHQYAIDNNIDKLMFIARDGYILKEVYDKLYNDIPSEYVLWSRHATLKTSPEKDINRFVWQFLTRIDYTGHTVKEVLENLNVLYLKEELFKRSIYLENKVTPQIKSIIRNLILKNYKLVKENSIQINEAAKKYYLEKTNGCKNIALIDLGWRASGAISLKELFNNEWNQDIKIHSLIGCGLSRKTTFDDTFVLNKDIISYSFSDFKDQDFSSTLQKNQELNMSLVEILLASAPKPSFLYFDFDEAGNIKYNFEEEDNENYERINELHKGIIDFVESYTSFCKNYPMLLNISGRDAFIPINSLIPKERFEKFINDFKDFHYSYLVSDATRNKEFSTLEDVYNDKIEKDQEEKKEITKKQKQSKTKKVTNKITKNFIIKAINKFYKNIRKTFKRGIKILKVPVLKSRFAYTKYYDKLRIDDNIALCQSYAGDNFSGNPYYMLKEIYNNKEYKQLKYYVAVKKQKRKETRKFLLENGLNNVNVIEINSKIYCKILATAKYLINNVGFPTYFIKKEGQIYVNTWHGTPLKGLGRSINDAPHESGNYQRNFLMTDYFILPNKYTLDIMRYDYMIDELYQGEYILSGYPRNSIFYNEEARTKTKEKLGYDENKKIIIYMPTWRRSPEEEQKDYHINKIIELIDEMEEKLDNNTIMYVKLHNLVSSSIDYSKYEKIKTFPKGIETYEMLNIADVLITDYSSVMFDFANTGKKIVIYAYDLEEYINGRSMYFDISNLPFPIVNDLNSLIKEAVNEKDYQKYKDFVNEFCKYDNISTCKDICQYIFNGKNNVNIIKEEDNKRENILIYAGDLGENITTSRIDTLIENVDLTKNRYLLNFYMSQVKKNRFKINELPKDLDYITIQGIKNMRFSEGLAYLLYVRFGISTKNILNKIENMYKREIKRLFPNIKFKTVIDMATNSQGIINMYKNIDANRYNFMDKTKYIFKEGKLYQKELERSKDKFKTYIVDDVIFDEKEKSVKVKLYQDNENVTDEISINKII